MVDRIGTYYLSAAEAVKAWGGRVVSAWVDGEFRHYEDPYAPVPVTDMNRLQKRLDSSVAKMQAEASKNNG